MITDQLLAAVNEAVEGGMSVYRLSQESGVQEITIGMWRRGEKGLNFASAAKIAETLGLELTKKKTARKKTSRKS